MVELKKKNTKTKTEKKNQIIYLTLEETNYQNFGEGNELIQLLGRATKKEQNLMSS